jgi:hypothetical protein
MSATVIAVLIIGLIEMDDPARPPNRGFTVSSTRLIAVPAD